MSLGEEGEEGRHDTEWARKGDYEKRGRGKAGDDGGGEG